MQKETMKIHAVHNDIIDIVRSAIEIIQNEIEAGTVNSLGETETDQKSVRAVAGLIEARGDMKMTTIGYTKEGLIEGGLIHLKANEKMVGKGTSDDIVRGAMTQERDDDREINIAMTDNMTEV